MSRNAKKDEFNIVTYIDLSKAFDCLQYDQLFTKMSSLGFTERTLKWFKSYLAGRKQCTDFRGDVSNELPCYIVKDEIRYLPGMNLILRWQVVCLCNNRNETVPCQEYINPAKEQFLSCPKTKIRFFPVIDPEKSWHIL